MNTDFQLLPDQASDYAGRVDLLYGYLIAVSVFFTALICFAILYFGVKYRRGHKADRSNPPTSLLLEVTWTVIPFLIVMSMFVWGAWLFVDFMQPPPNAMEIDVIGKQWMWKLQHPDGRREVNELHVPVGQPVRLRMISEDVIHSFYVPVFRAKMDVLPGRYTYQWFEPTRTGRYHLFCAEYCGTEHSQMKGVVHVMTQAKYAEWAAGDATVQSAAQVGERLFERYRCNTCHGGDSARAPSLAGLYRTRVPLKDGGTELADDDYLRDSIVDSRKHVVAGYEPIMPLFAGQIGEDEVLQLIAYIKTLTPEAEKSEDVKETEGAEARVIPRNSASDSESPPSEGRAGGVAAHLRHPTAQKILARPQTLPLHSPEIESR